MLLDIHLLKPACAWAETAREYAAEEMLDLGHDGLQGQGKGMAYKQRAQALIAIRVSWVNWRQL